MRGLAVRHLPVRLRSFPPPEPEHEAHCHAGPDRDRQIGENRQEQGHHKQEDIGAIAAETFLELGKLISSMNPFLVHT